MYESPTYFNIVPRSFENLRITHRTGGLPEVNWSGSELPYHLGAVGMIKGYEHVIQTWDNPLQKPITIPAVPGRARAESSEMGNDWKKSTACGAHTASKQLLVWDAPMNK